MTMTMTMTNEENMWNGREYSKASTGVLRAVRKAHDHMDGVVG